MIPTSTRIKTIFATKSSGTDEVVAVFASESVIIDASHISTADRAAAERQLSAGVSKGKANEVTFDLVDAGKGRVRRVFVVGVGSKEKLTPETFRQAGGALSKAIRKHNLPAVTVIAPADRVEAIVTGLLLASFKYMEYQGVVGKKKDADAKPATFTIVSAAAAKSGFDRGVAIATAQNFARTIASRPGNDINPPSLAKVALEMAKEVGLTCRVLDEKQMAKLGMGGILAVGAANKSTPPRMIVLEWKGNETAAERGRTKDKKGKKRAAASSSSRPLLAVGKAITFDTGGISIKPAASMGRMIYDKCGGMAVLGFMLAVAKLKLAQPVVGILSSAENHISDTAFRPGDILRMYNGVTVEVTNTDAEGRLVLGDALAWGIETYKPSAVVDLATLTGGVIVALGKTMAGVMGNDDALVAQLQTAADAAGEKFWRLPIGDDQRDYMKSDHADLVNSGGREGHPLQGGAFLSYFVPEGTPWVHMDIAGVADTEKELPYYTKGATGWGVRTLVEWAASNQK